jgi:hypothetical protein
LNPSGGGIEQVFRTKAGTAFDRARFRDGDLAHVVDALLFRIVPSVFPFGRHLTERDI